MISAKTAGYLSTFFDRASKYKILRIRFVHEKEKQRFEAVEHRKWASFGIYCYSTLFILLIVGFLIWQVRFSDHSITNQLNAVGIISNGLFILSANTFIQFNYKDCIEVSNMLLRLVAAEGNNIIY
jgi:hypothetical protein